MLGDVFWWRARERELEKCSDGRVAFYTMLSCFQEEENDTYIYIYIRELSINLELRAVNGQKTALMKEPQFSLPHHTFVFIRKLHCRFSSNLVDFNKQATFSATLSFSQGDAPTTDLSHTNFHSSLIIHSTALVPFVCN